MRKYLTPARGAITAALLFGLALPAQAQLGQAIDVGEQATRRAEQVQAQINQVDDERSDMVTEYRNILQRIDAAKIYVLQNEQVVVSQREEIASLTEQVDSIDDITAQTVPMLLSMIEDLKLFVNADLPFKMQERQARLDGLDAVMKTPNVTAAEQYRLIMEAYQAEMEYGRTVQAWQEDLVVDGVEKTVDMFTYGRVAYVYVTPDKKTAARWNRESESWEQVDGSYAEDIIFASRIALGKAQQKVMYAPITKLAVE